MLVDTRAEAAGPGALPAPSRSGARARWVAALRSVPWPIGLIVGVAAALRFTDVGQVSPDQFYDAAVRSMGLSWHNFLFGAFDPAGMLSVDKPPLDLWLQVISVKLFGWGGVALKLPEALCGTLAVPLLYDVVRRVLGRPAALAAAAALAVLPESVLTARSDTMDAVMMLLVIAALWLTVRAASCEAPGTARRTLVMAGAMLGLAFNVKLLQALLPLPALVVLYLLAGPAPTRRKTVDLAAAGAALILVGLSWAVVVTLAPGRHPWAVGSSDGSVWNAMFVFNGLGKLAGASSSHKPGGPGPFRLLVSTGWHYDLLFGCALVAAVAAALGGLAVTWRGRRTRAEAASGAVLRLPLAFLVSLGVWTVLALLVFDTMSTVHARYLDALAPALAALIGFGATALAGFPLAGRARARPSLAAVVVVLALPCAYVLGLRAAAGWGAAALILAAAGAVLLTRAAGRLAEGARWLLAALVAATLLVFPVHESLTLVRQRANDSLGLATAPATDAAALSRYLDPRTAGLRYEVAVDEPLALAPLIVSDQRPILPLTSFGGRPLTSLGVLRAAVAAGAVRYGLVGAYRCGHSNRTWAACRAPARWIRRNGVDVTAAAGLTGPYRLFRLS